MQQYILVGLCGLLVIAVSICTPVFISINNDNYNSYLHGDCQKVDSNTTMLFIPQVGDCHCTGCTSTPCSDITNVTNRIKCCGDTCRTSRGQSYLEMCEAYNLAVISGTQTYMDVENRNFTLTLYCAVGEKSCVTADLIECWTKDDEIRFVEPRESLLFLFILCILYTLLVTMLLIICMTRYGYLCCKYCPNLCDKCDDELMGSMNDPRNFGR